MADVVVRDSLSADALERVLVHGDLSKLSPAERLVYYQRVCESLGLNPLTGPFRYIVLNGRLTLYATRDATDQLRAGRRVSVRITSRELMGDVYVVTAQAQLPDGRTDEAIGAVAVAGLKGDALANAYMKAETKAKRRVTLSIVGLGWLDETETETIPGARFVEADAPLGAGDSPGAMADPEGDHAPSSPAGTDAAPADPAWWAEYVALRDELGPQSTGFIARSILGSTRGAADPTAWTPEEGTRVVEAMRKTWDARQRGGTRRGG